MDFNATLKHLAWITSLMVILQVIFYFVFQVIDYDSFSLSIVVTVTVLLVFIVLLIYRILKKY